MNELRERGLRPDSELRCVAVVVVVVEIVEVIVLHSQHHRASMIEVDVGLGADAEVCLGRSNSRGYSIALIEVEVGFGAEVCSCCGRSNEGCNGRG